MSNHLKTTPSDGVALDVLVPIQNIWVGDFLVGANNTA